MQPFPIDKYKRVVIFTAHPDDLEGFIGGTVKLLAPSAEIFSIIFSEGDRGRWYANYKHMQKQDFEDVRVSEAEEAKRILDLDYVQTLNFDDKDIPVSNDASKVVSAYIHKLKPDLILSFEYHRMWNFYFHPDHMAVASDVFHAVGNLHHRDFDYYVFTSLWPTHYVPITAVRKDKYQALSCHRSQKRLNKLLFFALDAIPTRIWGKLSHNRYAESFRQVKLI